METNGGNEGSGSNLPAVRTGTQFSSDYQPQRQRKPGSPFKSKRKSVGADLVKAILESKWVGAMESEMKKRTANMFGVKEKDLTVEMMMHMRQMEKAIKYADTSAYNAVMDRAYGKASMILRPAEDQPGIPVVEGMPVIQVFTSGPPMAGSEEIIDLTRRDVQDDSGISS